MKKYTDQILKQARRIDKAGVWHVTVYHDDRCSVFRGGGCDCEPEVSEPRQDDDRSRDKKSDH